MAGTRRVAALVLVACAVLAGCSTGTPAATGEVRVSTGSPRGVYFAWATALAAQARADHPDLRVRVLTSSGSVENLARVAGGTSDLAITTVDAAEGADAPTDLVALARLYDDYVHVVVRADGPVRALADLAGRPVAVGAAGSGVALVARRVLSEAGVRVQERPLDVVAGSRDLERGGVDAVFWSGGLPTAAVADLAARVDVRLLPLDAVAGRLRERFGVAYRPATVPAGSYGLADPVPTVASANLLVARRGAPPGVVTALLGTVFGRRDAIAAAAPAANALDRRTAISTGGLPLHPAAVEFYRRAKP